MSPAAESIPQLLYHALLATLHPSNTPDSVLTIRFSQPVRIDSIRIIPEGIQTFSGLGCTYPSQFKAKILFNVSPSNPVNGLSGTSIVYNGDKGWQQDYKIGMPDGVSTRMMIIAGKIDRLSLSVYGYSASTTKAKDPSIDLDELGETIIEKEDWSWISNWAGGVDGLVHMLDKGISLVKRGKAMECLELLCEVDPTVLDEVIKQPTAVSYLLSLGSTPSLLHSLMDKKKYTLHPNLRDRLPNGHRYQALVGGNVVSRRNAAWSLLPDETAFDFLKDLDIRELTMKDKSSGSSLFGRLLGVLEVWDGTEIGYDLGLDTLLGAIDSRWSTSLVRRVTPLIVGSCLHGSRRAIGVPLSYSRDVVTALIQTPPTIDDKPTLSVAAELAQPHLADLHPTDTLRSAFHSTRPLPHSKGTPKQREISRFSESLQSPENGYTHSLTPTQLLSVLAPELLQSLSTARQPRFGIAPVIGTLQNLNFASASTFAGKVYTSHDFRTRQAVGEQVSGAMIGNAGLGMSGTRGESRPASRHVDEYTR